MFSVSNCNSILKQHISRVHVTRTCLLNSTCGANTQMRTLYTHNSSSRIRLYATQYWNTVSISPFRYGGYQQIRTLKNDLKPMRELSFWSRTRSRVNPYLRGGRKFINNLKMAGGIIFDVVGGKKLNRRELRILKITLYDMLMLIPFAGIVALPGGTILIPIVKKYAPWAFPSTFQLPSKAVLERLKHNGVEEAKLRATMDNELQSAFHLLGERLKENKMEEEQITKQVRRFLQNSARKTSEEIDFDQYFGLTDDAIISNLSHYDLRNLCQFFGASTTRAYGPNMVMRTWLMDHMEYLGVDDQALSHEDLQRMKLPELQQACIARGIDIKQERGLLEQQLQLWLQLTITREVPIAVASLSKMLDKNKNEK